MCVCINIYYPWAAAGVVANNTILSVLKLQTSAYPGGKAVIIAIVQTATVTVMLVTFSVDGV